jgi:ABC-type sugar transport system substrate-binding protein
MDKLNVVLSLITSDNDYQRQQAAEAESTARRLGVDLQVLYAGNDAVEQSQQILKVVQSRTLRPNAIIVEPVGTVMHQVAAAAVATGISWVVMNRDADYLHDLRKNSAVQAFAVSTDNEEVGRIQARQFAALMRNGGTILYIEGPSTTTAARLRSQGMLAIKPANLEVKSIKGDWTKESGHKAITSWLRLSTSRQLRIGVVGCQNDAMAMGARTAFQDVTVNVDRDAWLSLPFTGCDGVPETGQAWVHQGLLAATVTTPATSGTALELFVRATHSGIRPPESTLIAPISCPSLEVLAKSPFGKP